MKPLSLFNPRTDSDSTISHAQADFQRAFEDPPAELRGKPFWSWNGELNEEELLRQMGVAKSMGMGGVFMHSRTGLKTEYLGKEWFELINSCSQQASELGLEGWLYDEDRWPSGSAGGKVTKGQAHRMRSIILRQYAAGEAIEWPELENFIEAHYADLDGLHLKQYDSVAHDSVDVVPAGRQLLIFVREIHPSHSFYNGGSYLDTLSRSATDAFIESTHEKYRAHCGDHFGKAIKGVFTDEPHRGFILCDAVEQPGASDSARAIPYTEALFEEFSQRFGYELRGRLPELYFQYHGERLSKLKWHYAELLQQLFIENWARPCLDWCESNDLLLTGHVLHEDSLAAQAVPCGSLARYYEQMSYPGIDVLTQDCRAYWVAKQVVSVARQQGQPYVLSELYGCTGWQMGFEGHKQIGDWQAFLGVNLRCHHLAWYSMAGEAKRDYPASIFHQSAWYPQYKYVEDYFSRVNLILQQGQPDCDVLVIHPNESISAQFHLGWATWLRSISPSVDLLETKFVELFHWLTNSQIDFDYGDEEQLSRLAEIEVVDGKAYLRFGQMRYRSIVVGGLETMRGTTLSLLEAFQLAGGAVIFAGEVPAYLDAERSRAPRAFAQQALACAWERDALVDCLRENSDQLLQLNEGAGVADVISHVRRLDSGEVFIGLVNTTGTQLKEVQIDLSQGGIVERLNCRSGQIEPVAVASHADGLRWWVDFESLGEHLYRVVPEAEEGDAAEPERVTAAPFSVPIEGPFDYSLSEPNTLLLERARYRLDDAAWSECRDILRQDTAIRDTLGWPQVSGEMMQPWCRPQAEDAVAKKLTLEFPFNVSQIPAALDLLAEQPERWRISLNGRVILCEDLSHWHIDIALKRIQLPVEYLRPGENCISMETNLSQDTDLEAIYLLGDFGVYRKDEDWEIAASPKQVFVGDLVEQGFPFYTGAVTYCLPLPNALCEQALDLELPKYSGACAEVILGQHSELIAFPPSRTSLPMSSNGACFKVKIYLTRQNLFGPLHRVPKEQGMTRPDSYRTVGDAYSEAYQLFPSGLLTSPIVHLSAPFVSNE
ncbi:hypothetical protein QEH52_10360 [Coraliomargarita sp. SDUM461003]|uniref:Glycoside hydrolase family 42 N-terminal domain-containing protein n=1 Tax=Thalassobacterium maritimum TaxID=3041265 RepID=A0ABU1AUU3_9BACT|nr:hypothetical protein [Coraliomargarita sp. SDUM461003]MDQ8207915.1 hypothetical protein [Coraliomargarita sp. SDUM461003]